MVYSAWLDSHHLAVNTKLRLFSCTKCDQLFTSKNLTEHLRKHHKVAHGKDIKGPLDAVVADYAIQNDYPVLEASMVPYSQIGGVKMERQFGCPVCPVAGKEGYIKMHLRKDHPDKALSPQSDVHTQCLNKGRTHVNLRVQPAGLLDEMQDSSEEGAVMALWKKKFSDNWDNLLDTARAPVNSRHISPWLLRTMWHKLIENKQPESLCALVMIPDKKDNLYWVKQLVTDYMMSASDLVDGTSLVTRQYLNSIRPNECVNIPLKVQLLMMLHMQLEPHPFPPTPSTSGDHEELCFAHYLSCHSPSPAGSERIQLNLARQIARSSREAEGKEVQTCPSPCLSETLAS